MNKSIKKHLIFFRPAVFLCLFLSSCSSKISEDFTINATLEDVLEAYCVTVPEITGKRGLGKYFCAFESYGMKKSFGETVVYVWVHSQEYYLDGRSLVRGRGRGLPVAFNLKERQETYEVIGCEVPSEGENYANDIRKIFPYKIQSKIRRKNVAEHNMLSKGLDEVALEKAEKYYFE